MRDKVDEIVNLLAIIDRVKTEYENYRASTAVELSGLRTALEKYRGSKEIDASDVRIAELEAALEAAKEQLSEVLKTKMKKSNN